ncbi:MAG: PTS sugar transporter subunit IIA [Phycisphaerales bacterium]|nr:MAG: PTS sugar transporter subunit IIA [Phycisphaerales bacterium]
MKFEDFVCFGATIPELEAKDRDGAIGELVGALVQAGRLPAELAEPVAQAVIKRENEASTGMGKGVAVPHVKHEAVTDVVGVVGQSSVGIDFAALDEQPVYSVLLLISPIDNSDAHLQAMEKIFKHLQKEKFRKFLRQCQTPEAFEDLLREADENPSW